MARTFALYRRQRSSWFDTEWHSHGKYKWLNISVGHPDRHAWWAFSLYINFY